MLAFDREGGLWLTHSTPEFPNAPSRPYAGIGGCSASGDCSAQHGQLRFGQSFMCVSLGLDVLDGLASAIKTAAPVIASWRLISGIEMPGIRALVNAWESRAVRVVRKVSWRSFASVDGQGFLYTVKSPTPHGQATYLYEEVLEPLLGDSLLVQSWSNVESECSRDGTAVTMTVAEMAFPEGTSWRAGFSDHSKWAVTGHSDIAMVCMADLNRDGLDPEWSEGPDRPQSLRGGGATCLQHPTLWAAMRGAIASTQPCVFASSEA
ncbi:g7902 [Coccomyxa viridis]|uniref:G7902 protein n=1 Tax=Coccomyxa viridis TaxID=1274662 RepID=A0ABP1G1L8_9CHLO